MKNFWKNLTKKDYIKNAVSDDYVFANHYDVLTHLHKHLEPANYLEIGIRMGNALNLSLESSVAVGVDPVAKGNYKPHTKIYEMTSDAFFEDENRVKSAFEDKKIDLAFIDGLHWFEAAFKDFINTEKHAHRHAMIILHDAVPARAATCKKEPDPNNAFWTGDVYKLVPALKKYRPDLKIETFNVRPSGLCFITNLNPDSRLLEDNYEKIFEEFDKFTFEELIQNKNGNLNLVENTGRNLKKILKEYKK